jgi:tetratricopeptide (TPR) repeat protein
MSSSNKRPRLSVAMIVRDEQDVLGQTLESINGIADEIVIEDTGSHDATGSVAKKWGARLHRTPWTDNFAAARNACLARTTGDWVLWLDAGEKLSPKSAKLLRDFVNGNPDPRKAYLMMVEVPPSDLLASGEQVAQIRLVPRVAGLTFEGRIRESMLASLASAGMELEAAPGRIVRDPREHDKARKEAKARRNLAIVELEKKEFGREDVRLLLAEGDALCELGRNEESRDAFSRAIELAEAGSTAMLEGYYGLLTCYNNHPQLHDCQLEAGLKALETFPFDAQLLLAMGSYLQGKGRLELASRSFEIAVKFGQVDIAVWHLREIVEVSTACLCMILQLQGRASEACGEMEDALRRYPRSARLLRHGVEMYIKMDEPRKAFELLLRQDPTAERAPGLGAAVQGACFAAKSNWPAAFEQLQRAYRAGCRHPLCLRWFTVAALGNGDLQSALPVLEQWRRAEPDHPEMLTYLAAVAAEAKTADAEVSSEIATPTPTDRQYRLDQGITVSDIAPLGLPIVHQFSSFDVMSGNG